MSPNGFNRGAIQHFQESAQDRLLDEFYSQGLPSFSNIWKPLDPKLYIGPEGGLALEASDAVEFPALRLAFRW